MERAPDFQDLAMGHLPSLHGYARLLSRNDAEAQDLLQEALLKALRAFPSFKPEKSFKVWMFQVIRNAELDRRRRLQARPREQQLDGEKGLSPDLAGEMLSPAPLNPEEILLRRVALEAVRDAIRQLPFVLREVVELRDIEGLSYRDIATIIGKPVGTVMSRLFRGRNLVRRAVQEPAPAVSATVRSGYGM